MQPLLQELFVLKRLYLSEFKVKKEEYTFQWCLADPENLGDNGFSEAKKISEELLQNKETEHTLLMRRNLLESRILQRKSCWVGKPRRHTVSEVN